MLLIKTLKTICFSFVKNLYCLNKFLLELFNLSGFALNPEKCSSCGCKIFERLFINYIEGGLECISCKQLLSEELSPALLSAIKILNNTDFEKLQTIKLAQNSEMALLKILVRYFETKLDKKLNFIGILK